MGTNGFQEPATGYENGQIIGTRRLYADGTFGTDDGHALFCVAEWQGLQAEGKEEQRSRYPYLINKGRINKGRAKLVWQSALSRQGQRSRHGSLALSLHRDEPRRHGRGRRGRGDLVEVWTATGSAQAMAYPTPTARRGEMFMLFGYPSVVQGNVVNEGVNELVIPNYKNNWADMRKLADKPAAVSHLILQGQGIQPPLRRELATARSLIRRGLPERRLPRPQLHRRQGVEAPDRR